MVESVVQSPVEIVVDSAEKLKIRVLHVDDDLGLLGVSKQILLMENNFDIDTVTSVDEAIKKLEKESYDAVVSDYEMPQKNGLDFLKELREKSNQMPFILFTGKGREDVVVKALNLGADSYINKNGSPETVYCELADAINKTVERKKSRGLLAKSESKYRMLVENSLQGISILFSAPLRIVFANGAFGKILGYSSQDLMSLSPEGIMGLVYHEDRAVFFERMENRLRGEPANACFEFRAVRKDGSLIWLSALSNRVDYDGQPAVQGMFLDISESKAAGEVLRESEQRYRELANCLPDIVFETDMNGQLVFANERATEISGYSHRELEKGLSILQFLAPEDRERASKNIQRLLTGGRYVPTEYKFVRKDGSTFPALITATPRVCKNRVKGLRGLVIDITERKKAEEVLQESEESFRSLIDSMDDLVFVLGFDGVFKNYHQPSHNKKLYVPPEEFIGKHFLHVLPPQVAELCQAAMKRIEDSGETQEFDYFMEMNGEKSWYNARLSPAIDQSGRKTSVTVVVRNITERKKAEQAVSASLKRYQSFIEVTGELGWTTNAAGEVLEDVPSFRNFTGQTYDEVKGWGWTKAVHPEDVEQAKRAWQAAVAAKTKYEVEYRLRKCDGVYRNFMARGAPILEEDGKIREWVGTCIDITERKENEEKLMESIHKNELINEKLLVVGSLTRHDVGNKLMVVKSNLYLLKKHIGDNPKLAKYLEDIDLAINQSDKMFEFSRFYEKIGVEEPSKIDIAQCFNQAIALLPNLGIIKIVNDCQGLEVMADSLLKQLFYNFVDNSLKHGEKVTQIRVHFTDEGDGVKLFYEDDGVGIPEANKPKLFYEGFTTGKSTGLGLFIIKKMVEVYGWTITEEGEPGQGAKFVISIPKLSCK